VGGGGGAGQGGGEAGREGRGRQVENEGGVTVGREAEVRRVGEGKCGGEGEGGARVDTVLAAVENVESVPGDLGTEGGVVEKGYKSR